MRDRAVGERVQEKERPSEVDVFTDKVISIQTHTRTETHASFDEHFAVSMEWKFHNAIPCGGHSVYWSMVIFVCISTNVCLKPQRVSYDDDAATRRM